MDGQPFAPAYATLSPSGTGQRAPRRHGTRYGAPIQESPKTSSADQLSLVRSERSCRGLTVLLGPDDRIDVSSVLGFIFGVAVCCRSPLVARTFHPQNASRMSTWLRHRHDNRRTISSKMETLRFRCRPRAYTYAMVLHARACSCRANLFPAGRDSVRLDTRYSAAADSWEALEVFHRKRR